MNRAWRGVAAGAIAIVTAVALINGDSPVGAAGDSGPSLTENAPGLSVTDPAQDGRVLFRAGFFLSGPELATIAAALPISNEVVAKNNEPGALEHIDALVTTVDELAPRQPAADHPDDRVEPGRAAQGGTGGGVRPGLRT